MSSQHQRLFPCRSVSIEHIILAMAFVLAVLVAACTAFSADAAARVADETTHNALPCLTPQATAASAAQNQLGFQLTTATTKATTTTTLTPERPERPNRPCASPRHDGTAQPVSGTPRATPSDQQRPTRVAEPSQPTGSAPQPPDGAGRPGEGAPPPPPRDSEPPSHSGRPNPGPRPTSSSGSGYPGPGSS